MDSDEMDSLFEGMVLFTPSQLAEPEPEPEPESRFLDDDDDDDDDDDLTPPAPPESSAGADDASQSSSTTTSQHQEPLDENLFSDLTLVTPQTQTLAPEADPITTKISRQISRKKKRAASLRIGYGRESDAAAAKNNNNNNDDDEEDSQSNLDLDLDEDNSNNNNNNNVSSSVSPLDQFGLVKSQISDKLNRARQLFGSASAAGKDSIRRRRKAADNLHLAYLKLTHLEKQLDDACEAEDFEGAERISERLGCAEKDKQDSIIALRDAEALCHHIHSNMLEALQSQIAAEEHSASLLHHLATDASNNADLVLKKAQSLSSQQLDNWFSSTEALEANKIQLEIESLLVNDARTLLNNPIDNSIQDDIQEKQFLCNKKDMLTDELDKLLALVKHKQMEIAENDSKIQAVEERIAHVVTGFQDMQSTINAKYDNLQSGLSQLDLERQTLSTKKKEIDDFLTKEEERGAKLRELARISSDEATTYQEIVGLRKSLMLSIIKSTEDKVRLAKTEEKLSEDVQTLQREVSVARASLQELSSTKSSIQQNIASFKQRIFFIDKRVPELEAEKKVAAAARNFKEAARIAAEAKSLSVEKDGVQIEMEKDVLELGKLEEGIKDTVNRLQETEGLILSKEKEVAMARFQRLLLIAGAAKAERSAALELGDLEEANLLLAEAEAADSEAKKLQPIYNLKEEEFANLPKHFISIELIANLGLKQLADLAASVHLSAA